MYRNIDQYLSKYQNVWFTVVGPQSLYSHYLLTLWKEPLEIFHQIRKPTVKECLDELDRLIGLGDIH